MDNFVKRSVFVVVLLCFLSVAGFGVSATDYRNEALNDRNLSAAKGELYAWLTTYYISTFVKGYRAYNDTSWLDEGVKYYDMALSKREPTHDKYLGWIGSYGGDEGGLIGEAFISDAQVFNFILIFCEEVMNNPALKQKYGKKAEEYIAEAKKQLLEKWDKRGCYYEDGDFAAYVVQTTWFDPKKKEWYERPKTRGSENLNKHGTMASCFLKLYRLTKEPVFLERAEKIFGRYKSIMRYYEKENRYVWNFWEPFGPFDMAGKPKNWVDVHPSRPGYQEEECGYFVEAYQAGVVFNEEDMKRLINANLWMWNKDEKKQAFKSSDGTTPAGALWLSLADFNPAIRSLAENALKNGKSIQDIVEYDYFKKVTCKEPASFKRRNLTGEVKLPDIPIYPSKDISMAVVIPAHLSSGGSEETKICCKVKALGKINVELYSRDGKKLIKKLFEIEPKRANEFYTERLTAKGIEKGSYRVRWTQNAGIMERTLTIE